MMSNGAVRSAARRRGGGVAARGASAAERADARIGILMMIAANDPEAQARIVAFAQALQALGWTDGCNARIDVSLATTGSDTPRNMPRKSGGAFVGRDPRQGLGRRGLRQAATAPFQSCLVSVPTGWTRFC